MWWAAGIGLLWGLCEGTWFFVIPDIALSFFAVKGWKPALLSICTTLLGSLLAAVILYHVFSPSDWRAFWSHFPGFYEKMFSVAQGHLESFGAKGLLQGPNSGIPYRFYVSQAIELQIPLSSILLWTPFARLERILIAPVLISVVRLLTFYFARKKTKWTDAQISKGLYIFVTIYWIATYVWYWGFFLPKTYGA